jgi:alpha-beta hydrolase superfamily lysophospholipase
MALVVITASGGAILTFTPHILASAALGFVGLLAFTGAAAASRWAAGGLADRFGATVAIAPLLFTGAFSRWPLVSWAAAGPGRGWPDAAIRGAGRLPARGRLAGDGMSRPRRRR